MTDRRPWGLFDLDARPASARSEPGVAERSRVSTNWEARKLAAAVRRVPVTVLHGGGAVDRRALLEDALFPLLGRRQLDQPAPGHAAHKLPFPVHRGAASQRGIDEHAEVVVLLSDWDSVPVGSLADAIARACRIPPTAAVAEDDKPVESLVLLVLEDFDRFLALDPLRGDVAAFRTELLAGLQNDPLGPQLSIPIEDDARAALGLHLLLVVEDATQPSVAALGRELPGFGEQILKIEAPAPVAEEDDLATWVATRAAAAAVSTPQDWAETRAEPAAEPRAETEAKFEDETPAGVAEDPSSTVLLAADAAARPTAVAALDVDIDDLEASGAVEPEPAAEPDVEPLLFTYRAAPVESDDDWLASIEKAMARVAAQGRTDSGEAFVPELSPLVAASIAASVRPLFGGASASQQDAGDQPGEADAALDPAVLTAGKRQEPASFDIGQPTTAASLHYGEPANSELAEAPVEPVQEAQAAAAPVGDVSQKARVLEALADEVPAEDVPGEDVPGEDVPVEDVPVEQAPVLEPPFEEAPFEQMPVLEAPVEQVPVAEAPVEEAFVEEAFVEEAPVEEAPVEEALVDEALVEEAPVDEVPIEEGSLAEAQDLGEPDLESPVSKAPAAEAPIDEAPIEEVLIDEVLIEHVPLQAAPVPEAPVPEAPFLEAPLEEVPMAQVAVEAAQAGEASVEEAPVEQAPVDGWADEETAPRAALVEASTGAEPRHEDVPATCRPDVEPEVAEPPLAGSSTDHLSSDARPPGDPEEPEEPEEPQGGDAPETLRRAGPEARSDIAMPLAAAAAVGAAAEAVPPLSGVSEQPGLRDRFFIPEPARAGAGSGPLPLQMPMTSPAAPRRALLVPGVSIGLLLGAGTLIWMLWGMPPDAGPPVAGTPQAPAATGASPSEQLAKAPPAAGIPLRESTQPALPLPGSEPVAATLPSATPSASPSAKPATAEPQGTPAGTEMSPATAVAKFTPPVPTTADRTITPAPASTAGASPAEVLAGAISPLPLEDLRDAGAETAALLAGGRQPTLALVRYDALQALPERGNKVAVQLVAPLFIEPIRAWVRADSPLQHLHQLEGRRVDIGRDGSGNAWTTRNVYRTMFGSGLPAAKTQHNDTARALQALQRGEVDAVWRVGMSAPASAGLRALTLEPGEASTGRALLRFLPVDPNAEGRTLGVMSFLAVQGGDAKAADRLAGQAMRKLCGALPELRAAGGSSWQPVDPGQALPAGQPYAPAAVQAGAGCADLAAASTSRLAAGGTTPTARRSNTPASR